MISRTLAPKLLALSRQFPATFLTGPRQSGKTTLARASFPDWPYRTLEDLQNRDEAREDPRGFLARFAGAPGLILDEVQRAPDLFSYLQAFVDEGRCAHVLLTGSQNFQLSAAISQTLAGRAAIVELLPLSLAELAGRDARTPADMSAGWVPRSGTGRSLDVAIHGGGYPAIYDRSVDARTWLDAYLRTYVERDVRALANVGDLSTFVRFMRLCAGRVGQLLNLSALGADAGVDHTTARRWISVLEASYVVTLLAPHHENFTKRMVKTPKLYFHDTGLACALLGVRSPDDLATHPLRGPLTENLVVTEFTKLFLHHGEPAPLYFWRDHSGLEVDLLVDLGRERLPVEVKSAMTVPADARRGLRKYGALAGREGGLLVYGGAESYRLGPDVIQSWEALT